MAKADPFTLGKRARSFGFAWRGVAHVARSQHNAWIHAAAALVAIAAGLYFRLGSVEWALLALAIVTVWGAEALNTAVEVLGDALSRGDHPLVRVAKDAAAGAVLITAVGAAIVGGLVFVPRIARLAGYGW